MYRTKRWACAYSANPSVGTSLDVDCAVAPPSALSWASGPNRPRVAAGLVLGGVTGVKAAADEAIAPRWGQRRAA